MGVFIGQSTRIYDRSTGADPSRARAGRLGGGLRHPAVGRWRYSLYCAVIVKRVDAQTRAKTSINELLRSLDS